MPLSLQTLAMALLLNLEGQGRTKFTADEIRTIEADEALTDYQRVLLLRYANEVQAAADREAYETATRGW